MKSNKEQSNMHESFALSIKGGAVQGFPAVGVVRFFQEEGLRPDLVAGASSGSIVAAMYALGMKWFEMREQMLKFDFLKLLSLGSLIKGKSLLDEEKVQDTFEGFIDKDTKIEDLPMKYIAFASNVDTKERVFIEKGNLIDAVKASMAFPILAPSPVKLDGQVLVDGDLTASFSTRKLKSLGVDRVIGVARDSGRTDKARVDANFYQEIVYFKNMLLGQITRENDKHDPVDLKVEFSTFGLGYLNFKSLDKYIDGAYKVAKSKKSEIFKLLNYKNK